MVKYDTIQEAAKLVVDLMDKIEKLEKSVQNGLVPDLCTTVNDIINDMDVNIYNFHICFKRPQVCHPADAQAYQQQVSAIENSYMIRCKKLLYTNPVPIDLE